MPSINPSTILRGNPLPNLRRQRQRWDPVRGTVYEYEWDSGGQAGAIALANQYIYNGIANTLTLENDKASLTAIDSTQENAIDSWEIAANEVELDLFSNPALLSAIATSSMSVSPAIGVGGGQPLYDIITAIRTALANNDDLFTMANVAVITNGFALSIDYDNNTVEGDATWTWVADYYTRYQQGSTSYRQAQYVLKHKTNVSSRWAVQNASDWGVNQVYSTASLMSEVTSGALWVYPLPPRLQIKLMTVAGPAPAGTMPPVPPGSTSYPANYTWGWLKSGSPESTEALNRLNIETFYTLYLWDNYVYANYDNSGGGGDV